MPSHDVECAKCGAIIKNLYHSPWPKSLLHEDGGELLILWHDASPRHAAVHPRERTVVYVNPKTGQVSYPPRNDAPMPERYSSAGFERREFEHQRDLEKFEKEKGVLNEKAWFNSGNGVE